MCDASLIGCMYHRHVCTFFSHTAQYALKSRDAGSRAACNLAVDNVLIFVMRAAVPVTKARAASRHLPSITRD